MKRLFHSLPWMILAVAAASPYILQASSDRSNQEVVFLNADATSFWRTATNRVIKVPVDMPVLATSAGVKCYPGIGYSVMKPHQDKPAMLAEQVQAIRDAGFEGFTVFDYTPITATALLNQFDE